MEILLLVITIVSLSIAVILGLAAWGMWREERARSAARVAALAAAARDEQPVADVQLQTASPPAPKVPLWSGTTEPRLESAVFRPLQSSSAPSGGFGDAFLGSAVTAPSSGGRQKGLAVAATALFVVLLAGAYVTIYGDRVTAGETAAAAGSTHSPLELISLRHERQDGALAITGLVRNPRNGAHVEKMDAVALLFDQQGVLVTSSRAGVDFTQLAPGDESPFVIRLDAPSTVARYRVSFRTASGVVPHIDRRGQEPIARDVP